MDNKKYNLSFSLLKGALCFTIFIGIMKLTILPELSIWWVLSPLIALFGISAIMMLIIISLIMTTFFKVLLDDKSDKNEDTGESD